MNVLHIPATPFSPLVDFKEGILLIEGESFPENAPLVYQPLLDWCKQYAQSSYAKSKQKQTTLTCKLKYYNTSSRPFLLEIVQILNKLCLTGHAVEIIWYYDPNDELEEDDINFKMLLEDFKASVTLRHL